MQRLFVANKPRGVSSNFYLGRLKKKYGVKKAGFSGTLDPFATGALIVAFGSYTKLFRFLNKEPKRYRATIWIGASSPTLDIEKVEKIELSPILKLDFINSCLEKLKGDICYTPPKFSAKKVAGKRAYTLARAKEEFELKSIEMSIYDVKLISYMHPFLTIELSVSQGAYVRSYAQLFGQMIGQNAILSALCRLSEGEFKFQNEKALNPLNYLNLIENFYNLDKNDILLGKKLEVKNFQIKDDGEYLVKNGDLITIFEFRDGAVNYLLNRFEI